MIRRNALLVIGVVTACSHKASSPPLARADADGAAPAAAGIASGPTRALFVDQKVVLCRGTPPTGERCTGLDVEKGTFAPQPVPDEARYTWSDDWPRAYANGHGLFESRDGRHYAEVQQTKAGPPAWVYRLRLWNRVKDRIVLDKQLHGDDESETRPSAFWLGSAFVVAQKYDQLTLYDRETGALRGTLRARPDPARWIEHAEDVFLYIHESSPVSSDIPRLELCRLDVRTAQSNVIAKFSYALAGTLRLTSGQDGKTAFVIESVSGAVERFDIASGRSTGRWQPKP